MFFILFIFFLYIFESIFHIICYSIYDIKDFIFFFYNELCKTIKKNNYLNTYYTFRIIFTYILFIFYLYFHIFIGLPLVFFLLWSNNKLCFSIAKDIMLLLFILFVLGSILFFFGFNFILFIKYLLFIEQRINNINNLNDLLEISLRFLSYLALKYQKKTFYYLMIVKQRQMEIHNIFSFFINIEEEKFNHFIYHLYDILRYFFILYILYQLLFFFDTLYIPSFYGIYVYLWATFKNWIYMFYNNNIILFYKYGYYLLCVILLLIFIFI